MGKTGIMTIRATIWDLGGVLVRTEDRQPRTEFAGRLGMTYAELETFVYGGPTGRQAALGELPAEQHWERVCAGLNLPVEEAQNLQAAFWGGDRVDQELVEYIRRLRPRFRTALLSNAWSSLRNYLADEWKIIDAFDEIIISAEVGLVKPDERIYQLALERLKVSPAEAVLIDDFIENVEGARAAGLHAIHFKNNTQALEELERLLWN
jgi:HAD superfamily hydrolase (TIGR01509 family)